MSNAHSGRHVLVAGKHRHVLGWKRDLPDHRDIMLAPGPSGALPPAADNSEHCSPVEDQADLGSCVGNSTTSAMEALRKKEGRPVVELSRLFVYYYARKVEGTPPTEDSGCQIRTAVRVLATIGACPEARWPYNVPAFSTAPAYGAYQAAKQYRITRYFRCPEVADIKRALADGYTVVGGFSVPSNYGEAEKSGIIPLPDKTGFVGGHAVHFVGYDDARGTLKFQNSWGRGWGQGGFGFLPFEYVTRRLADDFWTIKNET